MNGVSAHMRRENSRYAIRASLTLALSLAALCGTPKPATAQNLEALAAGAAGLGAGVWWTMSIASARARSGTVLYEIDDIFSYALPVGAVSFGAGLTLGLSEEERKPFVNYVREALDALQAGEPIKVAKTRPYGCPIRFAPESTKEAASKTPAAQSAAGTEVTAK